MITLRPIDENNFLHAASLKVHAEQQTFVQSASLILARAYAYRNQHGLCWGIYHDDELVGLAMLHDLDEEPVCYHLCEFMIDRRFQGRGFGQSALKLVLEHCRREAKFPCVEVCVKKENAAAIHVYEKAGFQDSGYIDPETPDCLSMVFTLYQEIRYRDIILRDMREADIEDDIRWNTVETEWALWDAPWEMEVELPKFNAEVYRTEQLETLKKPLDNPRWGFELDTSGGVHIGSVNSYMIDENWEWIRYNDIQAGQKVFRTIGIEICNSSYWSKGLGTQALAAFIRYHLNNGCTDICLQTWSGNTRMLRSAEKLGFVICHRERGNRSVRGEIFDGLTFRLNLDNFHKYLSENP